MYKLKKGLLNIYRIYFLACNDCFLINKQTTVAWILHYFSVQ